MCMFSLGDTQPLTNRHPRAMKTPQVTIYAGIFHLDRDEDGKRG